jgi:hypothetical protein
MLHKFYFIKNLKSYTFFSKVATRTIKPMDLILVSML